MARRAPKSSTPLTHKQQELARSEDELRTKMEKLERMISDAPLRAQERMRRDREELFSRATEGRSRLDVSTVAPDKRFADDGRRRRPAGSLRKERREGRIIFIVLLLALSAAILWLATHLHI